MNDENETTHVAYSIRPVLGNANLLHVAVTYQCNVEVRLIYISRILSVAGEELIDVIMLSWRRLLVKPDRIVSD